MSLFSRLFKPNAQQSNTTNASNPTTTPATGQTTGPATGPTAATNVSPMQKHRDMLNTDRDTNAPRLAQQQMVMLKQSLVSNTLGTMTKGSKMKQLRELLQKDAADQIENQIETDNGNPQFSEQQRKDAKQQARNIAESNQVVPKALAKYTPEVVNKVNPDSVLSKLETAAKQAYDSIKVSDKSDDLKLAAEAKKKAEAKLQQESAAQLKKFDLEAENFVIDEQENNLPNITKHIDIAAFGSAELTQRNKLEDKLVNKGTLDLLYKSDLYNPIYGAVLSKFGVGRRGIFRSKETNNFRQKMKDAARDKANGGIDQELTTQTQGQQISDNEKGYWNMIARVHAYDLSKQSVDSVMKQKSEGMTEQLLKDEKAYDKLKSAAQTAAYQIARSDESDEKRYQAEGYRAAKAEAAKLLADLEKKAVNKVRLITKGDKETGAAADANAQLEISQGVEKQVEDDHVAEKSVKESIEADNLVNGFSKIAKIIDMAVPSPGNSASLSFELKIPAGNGVYCLFAIGGGAEKEHDGVSVEANISFGAGFGAFGLDANFRAGLYFNAQGQNAVGSVNLISYGFYRRMHKISTRAASHLWSVGNITKTSKLDEAETWAKMVEDMYLVGDNYVDIGLLAQLSGELDGGVASVSGEASHKRLSHYDAAAIQRKIQQGRTGSQNAQSQNQPQQTNTSQGQQPSSTTSSPSAQATPATQAPTNAERAKWIRGGDLKKVTSVQGQFECGINGTKVGFGLEVNATSVQNKWREVEITASASVPFEFGEDASDFAKYGVKYVMPAIGGIRDFISGGKTALGSNQVAADHPARSSSAQSTSGGSGGGSQSTGGPQPTALPLSDISKRMKQQKEMKTSNRGASVLGTIGDLGVEQFFLNPELNEIGNSFTSLIKDKTEINKQFYDALPDSLKKDPLEEMTNKIGLSNSLDLSLSLTHKWNAAGAAEGWTIGFEIAETKGLEIDAGIVKFEAERSKRLMKIEYNFGSKEWEADILGIKK